MKLVANPRRRGGFTPALGTLLILGGVAGATVLTGCHSAFVETTLVNRTDKTLRLVEVDYPSASFGTQSLPPGASFHYKFKIIGEGPVKLTWTDEAAKEHTVDGPSLHEGQAGFLTMTVAAAGQTAWQTTLR